MARTKREQGKYLRPKFNDYVYRLLDLKRELEKQGLVYVPEVEEVPVKKKRTYKKRDKK